MVFNNALAISLVIAKDLTLLSFAVQKLETEDVLACARCVPNVKSHCTARKKSVKDLKYIGSLLRLDTVHAHEIRRA